MSTSQWLGVLARINHYSGILAERGNAFDKLYEAEHLAARLEGEACQVPASPSIAMMRSPQAAPMERQPSFYGYVDYVALDNSSQAGSVSPRHILSSPNTNAFYFDNYTPELPHKDVYAADNERRRLKLRRVPCPKPPAQSEPA